MKNRIFQRIAIACLFCLAGFYAFSQDYLEGRIAVEWRDLETVAEVALFTESTRSLSEDSLIQQTLETGVLLDLNTAAVEDVLANRPEGILLSLPDGQGGLITLQLLPSEMTTPGFYIMESDSGEVTGYEQGAHYQGIVQNATGSLSCFSFFPGDVMGVFATPRDGNQVIGRIPSGPLQGLFIMYPEDRLLETSGFLCMNTDSEEINEEPGNGRSDKTEGTEVFEHCMTTFIEMDKTLYDKFPSLSAALNYAMGCFNMVNTIYINDYVILRLNGIFVWTSTSPYQSSVTSNSLASYRATTDFSGSAHFKQLWVGQGGGGLGYLPSRACRETAGYSMAAMHSFFYNLPVYSWDVMVSAHEWGHNLGSNHTQWCGWSGGAIDNCYATEGGCSPGPAPADGGTIMSYCHLTSYGINFANGFGSQPGSKIRNTVAASSDCADGCETNRCSGSVRFVDIENTSFMYVIVNTDGRGDLIKTRKPGGTGHNMLAITKTGSGYTSVPGYQYFVGSQKFGSEITNVLYTGSVTIVTLADGKMVKVDGIGGNGYNMFALQEHSTSFTSVPGYPYYIGDAHFQGRCTDLFYTGNVLVMGFSTGKVLKVAGTGGTGHNMFAVTETSGGFNGMSGYAYYIGDGSFDGGVKRFLYTGSVTLVAFSNGKILKVNGTGGTGHNLFAVSETSGGFNGLSGYAYYIGDAKFNGYVTAWDYSGYHLLMGFSNKKMLCVNGTGGSGHNMFAVNETSGGFNGLSGYSHYRGDARFHSTPVDIERTANNVTFISFSGHKILKINGYGGGGHNMFAVSESSTKFTGLSGYAYYIGDQFVNRGYPVDVEHFSGHTFTGFSNLRALKVTGNGGTGHNMHAVIETPVGFTNAIGYNYYVGDQVFSCNGGFGKDDPGEYDEGQAGDLLPAAPLASRLTLFPNPGNEQVTIGFGTNVAKARITLVNVVGQIMQVSEVENAREDRLDISRLPEGMYLVEVYDGAERCTKTLVVTH